MHLVTEDSKLGYQSGNRAQHTPRFVIGGLSNLCLHLGIIHDGWKDRLALAPKRVNFEGQRTILNFPHAGFEIVEGEIAHLLL